MTECNLHTLVRLPNGVFNPCTGLKTILADALNREGDS
jgi:type I restriction enzyme M protein